MIATINSLSSCTGIDRRTVKKLLNGVTPKAGDDGADTYDLRDLVAAIRGAQNSTNDLRAQKVRETMHRANLLAIEERKANGESLDTENVIQVWAGYLVHVRQVIRHSELSEIKKREILDQLKAFPTEEYMNTKPVEAE